MAQSVKNPSRKKKKKEESACNAGDWSAISVVEDPLEKEIATLQYSCLGNPKDRGACWATVHGVA